MLAAPQNILLNWLSQILCLGVAWLAHSVNPFYAHWGFVLMVGIAGLAMTSLSANIWHVSQDKTYQSDSLRLIRSILYRSDRAFCIRFVTKYIVKAFFLPMMLVFLYSHVEYFVVLLQRGDFFQKIVTDSYWFLFQVLLTIDVLVFAMAYAFESKKLDNSIRSTQPYLLGWIFALACYPPFSSLSGDVFGWYANDRFAFDQPLLQVYGQWFAIVLMSVYVWATLALGWRAGNLVNRGIVTRGPYRYVRHPAYTTKLLTWHLSTIPVLASAARVQDWILLLSIVMSMLAWTLIYVGRAVTKEWHLAEEQEYRAYQKTVRWRFIPGGDIATTHSRVVLRKPLVLLCGTTCHIELHRNVRQN